MLAPGPTHQPAGRDSHQRQRSQIDFLLQIGIHSAIVGAKANADRAEEFDASAGNRADGHRPFRLRFVKRVAVPASSASQSRVDTGSTSRATGPYPGGSSARIHPAHHLQRWQVHSSGRLNGAGRSEWWIHDLHRGLYSTRWSRRNHSPERGALHIGQCTGLLLPLRPPSSVNCCHHASRLASAASGRSCLSASSGRSSYFLDLQKEDPPNTGRFSRTDIFTRSVCLSPHQAVRREVRIC